MSTTTTAGRMQTNTRASILALVTAAVAVILSVSLPFALRSTSTVFVHTPAATSGGVQAPASYGAPLLRSAHGG